MVQRGAFRKSLTEHRAAGTKPVMLWSHDPAAIIGVWTETREDEKGLFVRGQLVVSTPRGREAYDLLKAGALNGLSIGFRARGDIRARLVATASILEVVPAGNILDRNSRPAPDPSIVIGEDQIVDEGRIARDVVRVYSTLHVWKKEPGLVGVKTIAGAIRSAMRTRLASVPGHHFGDGYVSSERFLRDPDGETAHAVITIESLVGTD
jgi:hypothetical protein